MPITPTALGFIHRELEEQMQATTRVMNDRVRILTAAHHVIQPKITLALAKSDLAQDALDPPETQMNRQLWPSEDLKTKVRIARDKVDYLSNIHNKLTRADHFIQTIEEADKVRLEEMRDLESKIRPVWTALNQKLRDSTLFDDTDKNNFKTMQKQANLLRVLKEEILRNERKIEQVQRFADRYDPEHPENSPDYLLEYANIIFEETDHYGFVGEICHQRLRSHTSEPSERSGLEAYSTAVGICLKPHEVVRYINPLIKQVIEQDSRGRITTTRAPTEQITIEVPLKCASLLLLDMVRKKELIITIKGTAQYKIDATVLIATLMEQAKMAHIPLQLSDIVVDIPGWNMQKEMSQIEAHRANVPGWMSSDHTTDTLTQKIQRIREGGHNVLADEPLIKPHKKPSP